MFRTRRSSDFCVTLERYTSLILRRMVGASGFEPPASWSRTRRSSQAEPRPDEACQYAIVKFYATFPATATPRAKRGKLK
jgi:hypothetical protein